MKKTILTVAVAITAFLGTKSYAQSSSIEFGVKAGLNLSNITSADAAKAKLGYNFGVTADYAFTESVYLMSGLEFTNKGYKYDYDGFKETVHANYLQLPIHVGYKMNIAEGTKFVLHAGPYLAYGVGGSKDYFGDGGAKRFDAGLGLGVGLELNQFVVGVGDDFGLVNVFDQGHSKNMNACLSVGYKF